MAGVDRMPARLRTGLRAAAQAPATATEIPGRLRAWTRAMPARALVCQRPVARALRVGAALGVVAALLACSSRDAREPERTPASVEQAGHSCPSAPIPRPDARAPDVRPEHEQAAYWLAKLAPEAADAVLLDEAALALLRERVAALPGGWRDPAGDAAADPTLITTELGERLEYLRAKLRAGDFVELEAGALEQAAERIASATEIAAPNLHFVARETPLWCVPTRAGLYTSPANGVVDRDFDRNRCASLHPGEHVRALRRSADGAWTYVDAGHSVGWIDGADEALEPGLTPDRLRARLTGARVWLSADAHGLRHGSSFPLVRRDPDGTTTILVPDPAGPIERTLLAEAPVSLEPWPLTRRRLFEQAFALLGQPYGWGGREGQRDCSRYLLDLFALFDVRLARNSGVQAQLGTRSVDLSPLDEAGKRAAIRAAAESGVVLLYMPGHIMLYLGHDSDGSRGGVEHDYGISALSEYLEPCPGGPDTVYRLDRVAVTTLELGRGTERRAFIERITRMAVFEPLGPTEPAPGP
jgi:hypothetical protein